jgi:hypothetical protein
MMPIRETLLGADNPKLKKIPKTKSNIEALRDIVTERSGRTLRFKDGTGMKVDLYTASAIIKVYDGVNEAHKIRIENAVNESKQTFLQISQVAFKMVK